MSSRREDSIPHELRTAAEPRQNRLYPVHLSHVEEINLSIRLLHLAIPQENNNENQQSFAFLPGQWLDVHIPSISNAGGFTITSTPADAQPLPSLDSLPESLASDRIGALSAPTLQSRTPYVELAVQDSPSNPAAAWLWRPKEEILGQEINIRVGGSFTWPPTGVDIHKIKNVVFIAGGVGINPLISILSHLNNQSQNTHALNVHFLYSSRLSPGEDNKPLETKLEQVLFLPRLRSILRSQMQSQRLRISLVLFLTNLDTSLLDSASLPSDLTIQPRRIGDDDLRSSVIGRDGKMDPHETVSYICGPPNMTDDFAERLKTVLDDPEGQRIFFEKWW